MPENKTKNSKIVFKVIYYAIVALLLIVAVLLLLSKTNWGGDYKVLVVRSGSMEPAIKTGAVVVINPSDEYKAGDVITYRKVGAPDNSVTHRVIEVEEVNGRNSYITKGDANEDRDPKPVYQSRILGKVIINMPYLGYAVAAARTKYGFIAIVVIPALVIITDEAKKIYLETKRIRKKKKEASKDENQE